MVALLPHFACIAAVGLMYAAGAHLLASRILGVVAAGLLALTPLIWTQAATAPATVYSLPLVLAWLYALSLLVTTRAPVWGVAAGVALAAGVYVAPASAVMMTSFAVLTVVVLAASRALPWRELVPFAAAFVIAAAPYDVYWLLHPDEFRAIVKAHHLYDADRFNVLQGVRDMASWVGMTARSEVYWNYLNPAFLFVTGGVLPWPLIVLVPIGIYHLLVAESAGLLTLVLAGFFAAPIAASLTAEAPAPGRIVWIVPFAVLLATIGIRQMMVLRQKMAR